jgi:alkyl hydroperoxide reductase subunit D
MASQLLVQGESKYVKDLKLNVNTILNPEHLNAKETALLGLSLAANAKNAALITFFEKQALAAECSIEEIAEAIACASLLASNNVLYRFRHFVKKEKYHQLPGKIRMNIMLKPVMGKELFELLSLAVSAVNGCELCVTSHEHSLIELGLSEEKIFEAVRMASVLTSLDKVV